TDTQAIGFCSINAVFGLSETQLGEPFLQVIPGSRAVLACRTFRFGLIRAKENVALDPADSQVLYQNIKTLTVHKLEALYKNLTRFRRSPRITLPHRETSRQLREI